MNWFMSLVYDCACVSYGSRERRKGDAPESEAVGQQSSEPTTENRAVGKPHGGSLGKSGVKPASGLRQVHTEGERPAGAAQ